MIFIDRSPAPAFLSNEKGKWVKETNKAIAHYSIANQQKAFKYTAYNDSLLKTELKKVFTKCAYCESVYAATSDGDIEHFRPKGKVSGKDPETPGYYWLANDWDNLLLSCQHCNQSRLHLVFGVDKHLLQGKLDQFPLNDETKRVSQPGLLNEEDTVRLLINPCRENPEDHFEYDQCEGVIIPLTPMGLKSVDVYALQRKLLVDERKKRLLDLFQQIERVKESLEALNESHSEREKRIFDREFDILISHYTAPQQPYAGMCRFFVRRFLNENELL